VSEPTNRNLPAAARGITLVQLLILYTNPDSHDAERHRQTDGRTDGQTNRRQANIRSYCAVVRSAKMVH